MASVTKGIAIALIVVIVVVIIAVAASFISKSGTLLTFADGQPVSTGCTQANNVDILNAQYGPADKSSPPVNVMNAVAAWNSASIAASTANPPQAPPQLIVSAANLGTQPVSGGGVLTLKVRCIEPRSSGASGSARTPFSSVPLISCDRSADLDYAVDATVRGGTALVWAPYVQGSEFAAPPEKKSSNDGPRESFEPIPSLKCGWSESDAIEYNTDWIRRGAPAPQKLLYSTIANMPPARGVLNPLETEPENTITHLTSNSRYTRWSDPYLTDKQRFGPDIQDIPPGDPGYMVPVTDFLESFTCGGPAEDPYAPPDLPVRPWDRYEGFTCGGEMPDPYASPGLKTRPSLMQTITAASQPFPSWSWRERVVRPEPSEDCTLGGLCDSENSSTRFGRPAITTKRSHQGRR